MPLVDTQDYYLTDDGKLVRWMRPTGTAPTAELPGAATSVRATVSGTTATVTWAPPASDGGSPITGYIVTRVGGTTQNLDSFARSATFTGLTGTSWTFTVAAVNDVGTGPSTSVTVNTTPGPTGTLPRFPGDTRPLITGRIIWGVDEYDKDPSTVRPPDASAAEYFAPEAGTGAVFGSMRWYYTNWAAFDAGGAARRDTTGGHNKGRIPWMSMNPGNWTTLAVNATNAAIMDRWIAWVEEQCIAPVLYTIEHEPDAGTKVGPQGTYTDWMVMQRWFRARMDAYANAHGGVANYKWRNLSFAPIFTANGFANGEINSFIPTPVADKRVFDFIGTDPYATTHTLPGFTPNFAKAVAWAKTNGWAIGVGEWSVMNDDPQGAAKIQDMYDKCTNGVNDVFLVNYFNSGVTNNSQAQYWPLKNVALNGFMGNKFVALAKDRRTAHYWDLTRPDGVPYPRPAGV